MKILILSDSHRYLQYVNDVFDRIGKHISAAIHLGDGCNDLDLQKERYKNIVFYGVAGNCDSSADLYSNNIVNISGKKILITHGHKYNVKMSYDRVSYAASEENVDICLFGHSHVPIIFYYESILFMNPGSISLPKSNSYPSYGIIDISEKGIITPSIVCIENNVYKNVDFY